MPKKSKAPKPVKDKPPSKPQKTTYQKSLDKWPPGAKKGKC